MSVKKTKYQTINENLEAVLALTKAKLIPSNVIHHFLLFEKYHQPNTTVDQLSKEYAYTPRHIRRIIKKLNQTT